MTQIYSMSDTWNDVAVAWTAIKMDVTDTASLASSLLLDLQVGSVSQFKVTKAGDVTANSITLSDVTATRAIAPDAGALTIATGAVTATGSYHTLIGEGAAIDDLDTINGGTDGQLLILQADDDTVTITAKDGTGNLLLSADMALDNASDTLTLLYSAANSAWVEISRSDNGA